MMAVITLSSVIIGLTVYFVVAHLISYRWIKKRILRRQKWDLNICCGQTDGGGINVDIVFQERVPNCIVVENVYNLPFNAGQFDTVLCSHTIEHVDNPELFFAELKRVGKEVTIVIPPLYDITAAFNVFEHKHLFLSFKKEHRELPRYVKLPFSERIHKRMGQINHETAASVPLFIELIGSLFSNRRRKKLKLKMTRRLDPQ